MIVSFEDIGTLDAYFSHIILGEVLHVGHIRQFDHVTVQGNTNIARARITDRLAGGDTAAFGLTISFDDECPADTFQELKNGRRQGCRATDQ